MNLRRAITALLAILGIAFACSSPASAGGLYFGVNLELVGGPPDLQFGKSFRIAPLPIPGVQIGYDFSDGTDGFGARVSFNFFIIGQIALDGYYRLTLDAGGSNAYVGAGAEYQFLAFDTLAGAVGLHALAGLEWRLSRNFGLFIEATPGVLLQPPALAFTVIVRGGLVLRF